jgi:hypothetical protein
MTSTCWRRHRNTICRASVIYFFCMEGILTGTWASQLPNIQDRSNLSDGTLGLCVLFVYFGTVLATPFAGALNRAVGSKWSTITGGLLFTLSLPLVGIKLDLIFLIFGMLMFGTTMGNSVHSLHFILIKNIALRRDNGCINERVWCSRRACSWTAIDGQLSR